MLVGFLYIDVRSTAADPGRTCALCNVLLMYEAQGSAATALHLCLVSFVFMHAALLAGQCCKLL